MRNKITLTLVFSILWEGWSWRCRCRALTANIYAPLERVGVQDRFGEAGEADEMLEVMQISSPYIAEAARRAIARKG